MRMRQHRAHREQRTRGVNDRAGPGSARTVLRIAVGTATTAGVLILALTSGPGMRGYLRFTSGVLTLVSLTATVVWGLISTDRALLGPRHRLLAQAVHRATAVGALGFLVLHVSVQIAVGRVPVSGALLPSGLLPFGPRGGAVLIALGTLSGYLMVLAAVTGALRSAFAGRWRAGRWRVLHSCAYVSWCLAIVHGLRAGRAPAGWVVAAYALCLVAVAAALVVRLRPPRDDRGGGDRRPPGAGAAARGEGRTRRRKRPDRRFGDRAF
ncbi:hypothetical protein [Streptomyces sp. RKAG337]|uniref:hypothetical protein n=1 Tax=Streptomyces sp. RKAG337 TaxID=2893404 RepID=UPI0020348DD6|nr:hypothetical protein [Streptomyces sp. RKAG337]MCM2428450.1 hypothetical protein [Streptomyces sp. RKAG337]